MLNLILGPAGSGKSETILRAAASDVRRGRRVILLVPEQKSAYAEKKLAALCENSPMLSLEVLSFTRLCNHVFRVSGGLCYDYIDRRGALLTMWRTLCETSPMMRRYRSANPSDRRYISAMLDMITGFKRSRITPKMLDAFDGTGSLGDKISDLSIIFSAYERHSGERADPTDDLTRLSGVLDKFSFFRGVYVYIDSFNSFTVQEEDIIRRIISQAEKTSVALTLDPKKPRAGFAETDRTRELLIRIAENCHSEISLNVMREKPRFHYPELSFLEDNLWSFEGCAEYGDEPEHISLICAKNAYSEAEYIAHDIHRRIREGKRYRDFAVIYSDASRRVGITDAVFEKYGIPYFISRRQDITDVPLVRLIFAALSTLLGGFSGQDVISYIKTGLAGVSADDCDVFEDYIKLWNISGRRFTDEYEWCANPDGYSEVLSERGREILLTVNRVKKAVTEPLILLKEAIEDGKTVRAAAEAIWNLLDSLGVYEQLTEAQVPFFSEVCDCLDSLVVSIGDSYVTLSDMPHLLHMVFDCSTVGRIPPGGDCVIIGSAGELRAEEIKTVYVAGINDGEFPSPVTSTGLLSDRELEILRSRGINIGQSTEEKNSTELYKFYAAACCASENAVFSYCAGDVRSGLLKPSVAVHRIKAIFPRLNEKSDELSFIEQIHGKRDALTLIAEENNTPEANALREVLLSDGEYRERIEMLNQPVSAEDAEISPEYAKERFGGDFVTTQSRLESYVKCPFSYHCKYVLKLKEGSQSEFKSVDEGSFVHRVLEIFMKRVYLQNSGRVTLTKEECSDIIDEITDKYIAAVSGGGYIPKRTLKLFERLKRRLTLFVTDIIAEFEQSEFSPTMFELEISDASDDGVKSFHIPLEGGNEAIIYGKVDRVDTYKSGKDVYVRIVDYKTGSKDFKLEDVQKGLNMQMLLYLFAIKNSSDPGFSSRLGAEEGGRILPAGVIYYIARTDDIKVHGREGESSEGEAANRIKRDVLLLNDDEILRAMEPELGGKYIPVKLNSKGEYSGFSSLCTLEEFGKLQSSVEKTVSDICCSVRAGKAPASPMDMGNQRSPCDYCAMKPLCRTSAKSEVRG